MLSLTDSEWIMMFAVMVALIVFVAAVIYIVCALVCTSRNEEEYLAAAVRASQQVPRLCCHHAKQQEELKKNNEESLTQAVSITSISDVSTAPVVDTTEQVHFNGWREMQPSTSSSNSTCVIEIDDQQQPEKKDEPKADEKPIFEGALWPLMSNKNAFVMNESVSVEPASNNNNTHQLLELPKTPEYRPYVDTRYPPLHWAPPRSILKRPLPSKNHYTRPTNGHMRSDHPDASTPKFSSRRGRNSLIETRANARANAYIWKNLALPTATSRPLFSERTEASPDSFN